MWLFVVWRFGTAGAHSIVSENRASHIPRGIVKYNSSFSTNNGEHFLFYSYSEKVIWKILNGFVGQTPNLAAFPVFIFSVRLTGSEGPDQHANEDRETIYCELNSFTATISKFKMVSASSFRSMRCSCWCSNIFMSIIVSINHTKHRRFMQPNHKSGTLKRVQHMFPWPSIRNRPSNNIIKVFRS